MASHKDKSSPKQNNVRNQPTLPRNALLPVILTVAFFFISSGIATAGDKPPVINDLTFFSEGTMAPDFTLERLSGGRLALSELRGKVVLIDFWATW